MHGCASGDLSNPFQVQFQRQQFHQVFERHDACQALAAPMLRLRDNGDSGVEARMLRMRW